MVAQGQVVPVLPGGQLYQAIGAGEMAIREVLLRSANISDDPIDFFRFSLIKASVFKLDFLKIYGWILNTLPNRISNES